LRRAASTDPPGEIERILRRKDEVMKAHEALIAWTPLDTPEAEGPGGKIVVGDIPYGTFD
jgi:hypothetical protein